MSGLSDTKQGDAVAVYDHSLRRSPLQKLFVGRTTATRIYIDDVAYVRRTGRKVGAGRWCGVHAEPWNDEEHQGKLDEMRATSRLRFSRNRLNDFAWSSLDQEQANAVLAVLASFAETPQLADGGVPA